MTYKRRVSQRQRQVLRGIADDLSVEQIASRLGVSSNTVLYHLSAAFTNLNVNSRAAAVCRCYELGIFTPGEGHHAKAS
jgi:DNA-binding NarL/FixJ family response regulator